MISFMRQFITVIIVLGCCIVFIGASSNVVYGGMENAKLEKPPNGVFILPDEDTDVRSVFSFAEGKLQDNPFRSGGERVESASAFFERMQREKVGDVLYDNAEGGILLVCSRQAWSLGEGLLQEVPDEIEATVEEKDSWPAKVGLRYRVKTVEGKYALLRISELTTRGAKIEWIYQPDGSTRFNAKTIGFDGRSDTAETLPPRFGRISEEKDILLDSLPNGLAVLPDNDLKANSIFSFLQGYKLQKNPYASGDKKPESESAFFERLQRRKTGDLMYDDADGGVVVVVSMKVQALGEGMLSDLTKSPIEPKLESRQEIPARLGLRYLVRTVDGHYGIFRILGLSKRAMMIQWVYQPDESSSFRGTGSFLDRKVSYFDGKVRPMGNAVTSLRNRGFRVCFETADGDYGRGMEAARVAIKDVSVRSLMDELVKTAPLYEWEAIGETNVICIYPRKDSFLRWIPNKNRLRTLEEDGSWPSVLGHLEFDKHNVRFPHYAGLSVILGRLMPTPPDRGVSVDLSPGESARTVLAKICWAYGDEMFFTLGPVQQGKKGLYFETNPSLDKLASLESKPTTPKAIKIGTTPKQTSTPPTKKKPVVVTPRPSTKNIPLWAWPSFLIGLVAGIVVVGMILLLKKKACSQSK